jgi:hypothetical protein
MVALAVGVAKSGGADAAVFGNSLLMGGLYAGDRAARSVLRMRLAKLAHGQVELSRLKQEADGELVHVRGRVRARNVLSGLLDDGEQAVYRRVRIVLGQVTIIHEAAVDFALVDPQGEVVFIETTGARLVAFDAKPKRLRSEGPQAERLLALPLPKETKQWLESRAKRQRKGKSLPPIEASELFLRDGDEIEVVGYKNRVVDVSVEARLERDTPLRATLRAGRELPLILSRAKIS